MELKSNGPLLKIFKFNLSEILRVVLLMFSYICIIPHIPHTNKSSKTVMIHRLIQLVSPHSWETIPFKVLIQSRHARTKLEYNIVKQKPFHIVFGCLQHERVLKSRNRQNFKHFSANLYLFNYLTYYHFINTYPSRIYFLLPHL